MASILAVVRKPFNIKPKSTALALVPAPTGTWMQVVERGSAIVRGYHHVCVCGQEQPYSQSERDVTAIHQCHCGRGHNLLRSLGTSELAYKLSQLAIRHAAAPAPRAPFRHVDWPCSEMQWTGPVNRRRDAAFENADPSQMGPGF